MKNTKRLLALALVLVMSLCLFTGCAKDDKEALIGKWTQEVDISEFMKESVVKSLTADASADQALADAVEKNLVFNDLKVIVNLDINEEKLKMDLEPCKDTLDNLTTQVIDGMSLAMIEYSEALGLDLNEQVNTLGYASVQDYIKENVEKNMNLEETFEKAFASSEISDKYEIDEEKSKVEIKDKDSSWFKYELDGDDKVKITFGSDKEINETEELGLEILSGTFTKK